MVHNQKVSCPSNHDIHNNMNAYKRDPTRQILSCMGGLVRERGYVGGGRVPALNSSSVIRSWSRSWVNNACGCSMHEISVFLRWRKSSNSWFVIKSNGSIWPRSPVNSQIYRATLSSDFSNFVISQNNTTQQIQFCVKYKITKQCLTLLQLNRLDMFCRLHIFA